MPLLTDPGTRARLGPQGLDLVTTHLHAGDCQTCNRPLGRDSALLVDDSHTWQRCSLHHPRCRDPYWNDSFLQVFTRDATVSYENRALTVPIAMRGRMNVAMVLNPGLEQLSIFREGLYWQQFMDFWKHRGLRKPSALRFPLQPVSDYEASVRGGDLVIDGPWLTWSAALTSPCPDPVLEMAIRREGVFLIVSHAFRPAWLNEADDVHRHLGGAIEADDAWLAWVPLVAVS